jgi:diadenosine tetraphosphate (Ap4A) HIT family hydrolase
MKVENCIACQTLRGELEPPGGVIYQDDFWWLDHVLPPVFIRGKLVLKLKRHCEHLSRLTVAETATLGPLIQRVCAALQDVTGAEKIHVASYGEGVRHVHFLITPRTADLPAGNIYLTIWLMWRRGLYRLGHRRVVYHESCAGKIADQIRQTLNSEMRFSLRTGPPR